MFINYQNNPTDSSREAEMEKSICVDVKKPQYRIQRSVSPFFVDSHYSKNKFRKLRLNLKGSNFDKNPINSKYTDLLSDLVEIEKGRPSTKTSNVDQILQDVKMTIDSTRLPSYDHNSLVPSEINKAEFP